MLHSIHTTASDSLFSEDIPVSESLHWAYEIRWKMNCKKIFVSLIAATSLGLSGCGESNVVPDVQSVEESLPTSPQVQAQDEPTPESDSLGLEISPSLTAPVSTQLSVECAPGASTGLSLLAVNIVDGSIGHPPGAKTVTWEYSGDVNQGQVTFGVASSQGTRLVKYDHGEMISNSYMKFSGSNHYIHAPVSLTPDALSAPIPAAIGPSFETGWSADIAVDGVQVGECWAIAE